MYELLERILSGALRLPFAGEWLELERALPRSDWLALLMLQRRGTASMSDLAADLGVPLSTATGIGARLERRRLVDRERNPEDKRVILLRLTQDGQELAARARRQLDGILQRVQAVLSPEELQLLIGLVQKVFTALQAAQPGAGTQAESGLRRIPIDE